MSPILDKHEMYRRLNSGRLGQTLPAAETLEQAESLLKMPGRFAVREKTAGGKCRFDLSREEADGLVRKLPVGTWNLSPMLDDSKRVCYGHLLDAPGGWHLHFSEDPRPCRLKQSQDGCEQKSISGLSARMYLRGIMDQTGWDTLVDLVECYPDHVIEFTVMSSSLDAFGPSNTIFWEVREAMTGQYERNSKWGN